MPQRAALHLSVSGNISEQLDRGCVLGQRSRRFQLRESAFHSVDHRLQADITLQRLSAMRMNVAHCSADLFVRVTGDVFHQEIDQPRIALQDSKHLKRAIGRQEDFDGRRRRLLRRLFLKSIRLSNRLRQAGAEKDAKETAEG